MAKHSKGRSQTSQGAPTTWIDAGGRIRLAAGLGDPERERIVLSALQATDDIMVVERCLSADQLLACAQRGQIDAVLIGADLHRLTDGRLEELARLRVPLVLLAPDPDDACWQSFSGALLPLHADPESVLQALLAVLRGERPGPSVRRPVIEDVAEATEPVEGSGTALSTIAVAGGHGSPGRTTVALGLAAALGAVASTVLVDVDLASPSLAACLDADPTRNLSMLVYAEPDTPRDWDRAIAQEVQPLHSRSPHGVVLCGVPKPEMRSAIPARFAERLVSALQQRYRYVILDVGVGLLGPEAVVQRTALALAQQVLVVSAADIAGLWQTRVALGFLQGQCDLPPERIALVINRYDRRYHHGRAEIEWALGIPAAAVVPHDYPAMQRALAAQHPVILEHHSKAARALIDLAERVHGDRILLPPEASATTGRRWSPWCHLPVPGWRRTAEKRGA